MSDFITLYTDASVKRAIRRAQVAWRGKCSFGMIEGVQLLRYSDHVAKAEMKAILCGVHDAIWHFPQVTGFFINSDNLQCVQTFWTFRNKPPHKDLKPIYDKILEIADGRWIRAKHVKAHTGGKDVRSWMNRRVDKLTRSKDHEYSRSEVVAGESSEFEVHTTAEQLYNSSRHGGVLGQEQTVNQDHSISEAPDEEIHSEVI